VIYKQAHIYIKESLLKGKYGSLIRIDYLKDIEINKLINVLSSIYKRRYKVLSL